MFLFSSFVFSHVNFSFAYLFIFQMYFRICILRHFYSLSSVFYPIIFGHYFYFYQHNLSFSFIFIYLFIFFASRLCYSLSFFLSFFFLFFFLSFFLLYTIAISISIFSVFFCFSSTNSVSLSIPNFLFYFHPFLKHFVCLSLFFLSFFFLFLFHIFSQIRI